LTGTGYDPRRSGLGLLSSFLGGSERAQLLSWRKGKKTTLPRSFLAMKMRQKGVLGGTKIVQATRSGRKIGKRQ